MSSKSHRPTLAAIIAQEQAAGNIPVDEKKSEVKIPVSEKIIPTEEKKSPKSAPISEKSDNVYRIPEKRSKKSEISKADYIKVTGTLPEDLFLTLDGHSLQRRMAKLPYTYSDIIREALHEYFERHKVQRPGRGKR